jgi:hypothetical protein
MATQTLECQPVEVCTRRGVRIREGGYLQRFQSGCLNYKKWSYTIVAAVVEAIVRLLLFQTPVSNTEYRMRRQSQNLVISLSLLQRSYFSMPR